MTWTAARGSTLLTCAGGARVRVGVQDDAALCTHWEALPSTRLACMRGCGGHSPSACCAGGARVRVGVQDDAALCTHWRALPSTRLACMRRCGGHSPSAANPAADPAACMPLLSVHPCVFTPMALSLTGGRRAHLHTHHLSAQALAPGKPRPGRVPLLSFATGAHHTGSPTHRPHAQRGPLHRPAGPEQQRQQRAHNKLCWAGGGCRREGGWMSYTRWHFNRKMCVREMAGASVVGPEEEGTHRQCDTLSVRYARHLLPGHIGGLPCDTPSRSEPPLARGLCGLAPWQQTHCNLPCDTPSEPPLARGLCGLAPWQHTHCNNIAPPLSPGPWCTSAGAGRPSARPCCTG